MFYFKYRNLYAVTARESYLLPGMDECMNFRGEAPVSLTRNATSNFWQIEVEETIEANTAIASHHELYQLTLTSFGLKNASAILQRLMDIIISSAK